MGSVVKSVSDAVGSIGKSIGGPIGGILEGVSDFAKSPLGQMAIQAGLAYFTGGASLMEGGGLASALGGGGLSSLFGSGGADALIGNFAQSFLSDPSSLLSGAGLNSLVNLSQGMDSGSLLNLLNNVGKPAGTDDASLGAQVNEQQLAAFRQAQQIA